MSARKRVHKNVIKVILLPLGGETKQVVLEQGASVSDALKAGGLDFESTTEVRVNGDILENDMEVEDGDELIISSAGKIEAGRS